MNDGLKIIDILSPLIWLSRAPASLSFLIENIAFTIDKPEPFPTTLMVAPIASIAVIGIVLLVYFK